MRPNFHYKIKAYDTILPQDDPNKFQRSLELQYKQTLYKYSEQDTGLPGLIEKIPTDEEFSTEYYLVRKIFDRNLPWGWGGILKWDLRNCFSDLNHEHEHIKSI